MKCVDLSITIAGIRFKNPVMTASGTFGSGRDYCDFIDLNELGAVVCKGVSSLPWNGNRPPRIAEVYGGVLNSVGLQNPGVQEFIANDIPFLRQFDTKIIANLAGKSVEEYCDVAQILSDADIDAMELNISCPNIKEGGVAFGTDAAMAEYVTSEVRQVCTKPLIVKLSPNVTDITQIAQAVERGGADAVSMINTLVGMKVDIERKRPVLAMNVGGMSGPAIKPVALRMVYQTAKVISLPIIGMGGISNADDAIEFLLVGARGIAVGSANFRNPNATIEVKKGITAYMRRHGFASIQAIHQAFQEN